MLTVLSLCEKSRSRRTARGDPYYTPALKFLRMIRSCLEDSIMKQLLCLVEGFLKTSIGSSISRTKTLAILASITDLLDRHRLAVQNIFGSASPRRILEDL
jgi:hypothetical protein